MKQYTERKVIMLSKIQINTLNKLKKYNINVSQFVRQAIKEKIDKEKLNIKIEDNKIKNAPNWVYK